MSEHTLLVVMAWFVFLAAIALVAQAAFLFGIYRAARAAQQTVQTFAPKAEALLPKAHALLDSSHKTIEDSRRQIADITTKASDILATTHTQVQRIDSLLEDASTRARIHMDRADLLVGDALDRAHKTVIMAHGGVVRPLQQIQGVVAGLRTAIQFLSRSRPNPTSAHADEEMFI
jgi:ABC-type transporter Mla subunit MlaD